MPTSKTTGNVTRVDYTNEKETFPISVASTGGTISTVNGVLTNQLIEGTGTSFTTDLECGDWIWTQTGDELLEVEQVMSDTQIIVRNPNLEAIAAETFNVIKKAYYTNISWAIDSVGPAKIDEFTYDANRIENTGNAKPNQAGARFAVPVLIDSTLTGNSVKVTAE